MGCTDNSNSRGQARMGGLRPGANLVLTLAMAEPFSASATNTSGFFNEYVVTGEEFERLGPAIQDIVIHAEGSNFTSNFSYDVVLQYKYELGNWSTVSLLGIQTGTTYVISTPFVDRVKLGMRIRVLIRTQITSVGGATPQTGTLNVTAAVRLYCG